MILLQIVQRRVNLMTEEGIEFVTGVEVGKDLSAQKLKKENDAVLLALGATHPRDLPIPGTCKGLMVLPNSLSFQ